MKYLATDLLKDDEAGVREEAARGLATASRRGDEGYLLEAVSHEDIWVRSWAGEGLARLGDPRCLPVLVGTLRHEHLPIRRGAVLSFAAFGAEGFAGLLQGLDDDNRELEELVFSIVLSHDLGLARRGESPTLLAASLSAARPEVRYAAARALELRADVDAYTAHLVEVLSPEKPEKAADLKSWPEAMRDDGNRARLMVSLAEALGSSVSEQRYAAASALLHKANPKAFFKAAEDAVKMRSLSTPWTPDNRPRAPDEGTAPTSRVKGFLRRVFSPGSDKGPTTATSTTTSKLSDAEQQRLRLLAFGAYVGLLRQAVSGDDAQRVRRDAVDRIVELGSRPVPAGVGKDAALPALTRALDDAQHLVRKAALQALRNCSRPPAAPPTTPSLSRSACPPPTSPRPPSKASPTRPRPARRHRPRLASRRGPPPRLRDPREARPQGASIPTPRRSRQRARRPAPRGRRAARLRRRSPRRRRPRRGPESEHGDVRLRAAEILAQRDDERGVDILATLARSDDPPTAARAEAALVALGSPAAVRVLAARADELVKKKTEFIIVSTTNFQKACQKFFRMKSLKPRSLPGLFCE